MSWQTYVDEHLMCDVGDGHTLTASAIIGHDGSVWAQSETFPQVMASQHSSAGAMPTSGTSFGASGGVPVVTWSNFRNFDREHSEIVILADSSDSETDTMEEGRLVLNTEPVSFARSEDYRVDFPKDRHLMKFLQSCVLNGKQNIFLTRQMERAILTQRDNLAGSTLRTEPIYRLGEPRMWAPVLGVSNLTPDEDKLTRTPTFVPARWDNSSGIVSQENSTFGLFLAPLKWGYSDEPYVMDCLALKFKYQLATGWFADLRATDAHSFRAFAIEATEYVLQHYAPILITAGVYHSVYAARYRYPISRGLCCGLIEVFNSEFNTFYTAEGETSLDLWSLSQLTGLPIDGEPYEEVCLPDSLKDETDGEGHYTLGYSYRYLMKAYRSLFLSYCGGEGSSFQAKKMERRRIRVHMWLEYFFLTEQRYDDFPSICKVGKVKKRARRKVTLPGSAFKGHRVGPNPANVDPYTHCAAYLVYWLCTFALPSGDDTVIRPEVIYPACQMAWGLRLSLCPAALCLIYRTLGELSRHDSPRSLRVVGPMHFLSVWAYSLFPEFAPRSLQAPLLFPRMLEFASAEPPSTSFQLYNIRGRLTTMPMDSLGTIHFWTLTSHSSPLVNRYRECNDSLTEEYSHPISSRRVTRPVLEPELREWALSIRPSVLVFRRGNTVYLEPYYPFRFGRNFGYDQHIPSSSAQFFLTSRVVIGSQAVDHARTWWDYFHRRDPSTFRVPAPGRIPCVTPEYIKWWNARTGFYRAHKLDCWDKAEQKVLKVQTKPVFDIDKDHLLRLKSNNMQAVEEYLRSRKVVKKQNPAPSPLLPEVSVDDFSRTLRHLCNISADRLEPTSPFPIEESLPTSISCKSEVDKKFPCRTFVPRVERNSRYYEHTSWLFVLLQVHGLTIESGNEVILDRDLHVSFHYAEGWGMDHLGLYYFLSSSRQGDLAALVECCQKINDVCWLVKEAASRDKQIALTYWPLSCLYNGAADRSAGQRLNKYQELLLAVEKPAYFEPDAPASEISPPLAVKRLTIKRSPVVTVVVKAKKASASKRRKIALEPRTSLEGSTIPSFEEFVSEHVELSPRGTTPLPVDVATSKFSPPVLLATLSFKRPTVVTDGQEVVIPVSGTVPGEEVNVSVSVATPPILTDVSVKRDHIAPSTTPTCKRASVEAPVGKDEKPLGTSSRVVGRLAHLQIYRGSSSIEANNTSHPVPILSESSSKARDASPEGSSSADSSKVGSHFMETLVGETVGEVGTKVDSLVVATPIATLDPRLSKDVSTFAPSAISGVAPSTSVNASMPYELSLVEAQEAAIQPAPLHSTHLTLPRLCNTLDSHALEDALALAPSLPLLQLTLPAACTVEATTEQVAPFASSSIANLVTASSISSIDSVLVTVDVHSSPERMIMNLWSEVDNQVDFRMPPTAPSVGAFPSDMSVKQNLAILQSMIVHDSKLTYSTLKATIEKITEVLIFMGCPLEDWSRRVTLLLKYVRRREFLANELPCQLAALEAQRSEHEAVLKPLQGEVDHLCAILDNSNAEIVALENKVVQLKAELDAVETQLQKLTISRAQHADTISSAQSRAASATLALKELQSRKKTLEEMSAFPFVGILPPEEIFRDL